MQLHNITKIQVEGPENQTPQIPTQSIHPSSWEEATQIQPVGMCTDARSEEPDFDAVLSENPSNLRFFHVDGDGGASVMPGGASVMPGVQHHKSQDLVLFLGCLKA